MRTLGHTRTRVDTGMIVIASVMLAGVVILAAGYFTGNRVALFAGGLVTLAGVFTGIQRLIIQRGASHAKRS